MRLKKVDGILILLFCISNPRDSRIAQSEQCIRVGCWLGNRDTVVQLQAEENHFPLLHRVRTGIGDPPRLLTKRCKGSFLGNKQVRQARFDSRQMQKIVFFAAASRRSLDPAQPPIQWVPNSYLGTRLKLAEYMIRLRIRGVIHPLSHTS
jgi:hypothetical protein